MHPIQVGTEVVRSWPKLQLGLALTLAANVFDTVNVVDALFVSCEIVGGAEALCAITTRDIALMGLVMPGAVFVQLRPGLTHWLLATGEIAEEGSLVFRVMMGTDRVRWKP
jgi:hypothetical protein